MGIVRHELRNFPAGDRTVRGLVIYVENRGDTVTGADALACLAEYEGLTITVGVAMSDQYAGYSIDLLNGSSAGDLTSIKQTLTYQGGGVNQFAMPVLYNSPVNQGAGNVIATTGFSWGYDGGSPWVEAKPLIAIANANTGEMYNTGNDFGGSPSFCFSNDQGITIVADGGFYFFLIGSTQSVKGYTNVPFTQRTFSVPVYVDDISVVPPIPTTDPYDGAGDSTEGGGNGTFDYSGNPPGGFDDFVFPSISAVDTGFVTLYNPTITQLKALSNYLWSNSFDLNVFKKIVNDPMDLFLGLSIVPVAVPDGGSSEVGIGLIGSGVFMTKAASQWASVDCGSITIPNFTGGYLDYDPYTQIEIYLPYVGVRTLKADEVVGHELTVSYTIDLLSGACVAWLDVDGHLTYTYMGQCATSIPIVSGDWTNLINGIISIVGSAAGGAIKGGIGGAIAGGVAAASSVAVNDSKISVDRGGSISSAGGLIAHPKPFLIMSAPRLCKPAMQNIFSGYPDYVTHVLSDLAGYTEVEEIRLQGVPATDEELDELQMLLKSGVIL